ncbi:AAA family ATPase [uncultured Massilia sp.]|uniref:AAA family ATPase n=1 Tax=uncultured Massilia sp. TaxID=169973 RepID=UPI0025EE33F8|nr:ATP-binding protein [uncultured Massilia sp.]
MIEKILIQNFKSLADVMLDFTKFTCFVGMNGAGKSSILQALDFVSQQMRGDISGWLEQRAWDSKDLGHKGGAAARRSTMTTMQVHYRLRDGRQVFWVGFFHRASLQMVTESAELRGATQELLLRTVSGIYYLNGASHESTFNYQGSILSQLKDDRLPAPLLEFRNAIANIQSLELLSPALLRKRSRAQDKHIGVGGEKLAGFLDTIKGDTKEKLVVLLKTFYPSLVDFRIATAKGGWKRLIVSEERALPGEQGMVHVETGAMHVNDGLLRILAILAQIEAKDFEVLLLDEVEDGINPEIMERLVDVLVSARVQVIVTTHSPMVLNYLEDDIARASVRFVYKSPDGQTRVRPFFAIPRMAQKLQFMGPGEAFVDTDLVMLADECIEMDEREAQSR